MPDHSELRAVPGDRLVIKGHRVGEPERGAEILEVLGEKGGPPDVERWENDGHVGECFPGSDAYVHHFEKGADAYLQVILDARPDGTGLTEG